jgi:hypothetical protein
MIEVINFEDFKEQIPNTYGYISLGGFKLPDEFKKSIYIQSDYYKATCKVEEKTVDLIIAQTGYFSNSVIVLGDLTNIPGEFLVDQEELYTALEIEMEKLNPKIDNSWSIDWSGVQRTTSTVFNNFTCKVDYVTKS